jgi:translation initiation factor 3 subunit G
MLPETIETGPDENGYYTRVEYKINERNNQVKITTRFKKFFQTRKVYPAAIERRENWVKFGAAASENNNSVTCFSDELVFMEPPSPKNKIKNENVVKKEEHLEIKEEKPKIICKKCNGSHWSRICDSFVEKEKENKSTSPPLKTSIQIINLGKDINEADLYDLFSTIGTIKRIFIARDYESQVSRGFGFATFTSEKDTENVIKRYNNYPYNNLIMQLSLV